LNPRPEPQPRLPGRPRPHLASWAWCSGRPGGRARGWA